MILLIDLILHKLQAYRHLLYNVINRETVNLEGLLWNSTIGFILLDAYRSLLLRQSNEELSSFMNFSSLVWLCQKIWKFPSSVIFIIDLLVLSSNIVALKGIRQILYLCGYLFLSWICPEQVS
ncbi:protein ARV 2-like isoform X2 [Mangifera indica]|uniref:protein ARV 2-like isoform X2 n=1 Tax=Mangifera indica TaxID=29780 RepID=UPI001CF9F1C1|nr:protein ARV 2-like isoform X2 [Mangifera indica]XP_044491376.1 protein ARV 2-like isoform X2 [Mangifera indica]